MDELTLLSEMRADVPPPSPEVVAAARARVGRRRRPARRYAVAAVAAAVAVLALPVVSFDRTPPRDAAAAEVLRRASRAAATQPAGSGTVWYSRSRGAQIATNVRMGGVAYTARETSEREIWLSRDRGGRLTTKLLGWEPVGPRDRALAEQYGDQPKPGRAPETRPIDEPALFSFGHGGLTWDELHALPTDPDELEFRMRRAVEGKRALMFAIVGDLLRESPAPPALRAALYEVGARLPGVRLLGETTDPIGRRATAVAYERDGDGTEHRLLLDPDTGELLAEETWLTERVDWVDAEPGTRLSWNAYEQAGYVAGVGERP